MGGWRVVAYYQFRSMSRNKYAGHLPFWLQIPFAKRNDAPTISIRCVMGLKKTRAFLIERGQPSTVRYRDQ
jgi:hypothetical protein